MSVAEHFKLHTEPMAETGAVVRGPAAIDAGLAEIVADVSRLADYAVSLRPSQVRALVEVIAGAGAVRFDQAGPENDRIVLWNNGEGPGLRFLLSTGDARESIFHSEQGEVPRFRAIAVRDLEPGRWRLWVDYLGLTSTEWTNGRMDESLV